MDNNELASFLRSNYLFADLSEKQLQEIISTCKTMTVPKHNYIVMEGEASTDIWVLLKGKVEVLKKDVATGNLHQISQLNEGEVIGEMALIDRSPRSASVRTMMDSEFLVLPNIADAKAHPGSFAQIVLNISKNLTKRLRTTNEVTEKALEAELQGAKIRNEMGNFLFRILLILSMWIILFSELKNYSINKSATIIVSGPIIIIVFLACFFQVKSSSFPMSFYGFNLKNWKKNIWESFLFSIPLLGLGCLFKLALIHHSPSFNGGPFFNFKLVNPDLNIPPVAQVLFPLIYIFLVPLQEFIARGTIQSVLSVFLVSRSAFWSILISNLLFASFHSHLSAVYVLAAFLGGLFWGLMYARQKSLVGPIFSHALIGFFILIFLGLGKIFTEL